MESGIYKITHRETGRAYIGQSKQIQGRLNDHRRGDGKGAIAAAVRKFGWKAFDFEILELAPKKQLNTLEVYYIKLFDTLHPAGFNLNGGGSGSIISQTALEHMTESNRRKAADPEWIEKNRIAMKKLSEDPEWRSKHIARTIAMAKDPKWRAAHLRAAKDPEVNRRRSEAAKKQHADPISKAKHVEAIRAAARRRKGEQGDTI